MFFHAYGAFTHVKIPSIEIILATNHVIFAVTSAVAGGQNGKVHRWQTQGIATLIGHASPTSSVLAHGLHLQRPAARKWKGPTTALLVEPITLETGPISFVGRPVLVVIVIRGGQRGHGGIIRPQNRAVHPADGSLDSFNVLPNVVGPLHLPIQLAAEGRQMQRRLVEELRGFQAQEVGAVELGGGRLGGSIGGGRGGLLRGHGRLLAGH